MELQKLAEQAQESRGRVVLKPGESELKVRRWIFQDPL